MQEEQTILNILEKLEKKMDVNHEKIIERFDNFKDEVCTPSRMSFEKKITKIETKEGIIGTACGIVGGILARMVIK